jgi:hypothetical protein
MEGDNTLPTNCARPPRSGGSEVSEPFIEKSAFERMKRERSETKGKEHRNGATGWASLDPGVLVLLSEFADPKSLSALANTCHGLKVLQNKPPRSLLPLSPGVTLLPV